MKQARTFLLFALFCLLPVCAFAAEVPQPDTAAEAEQPAEAVQLPDTSAEPTFLFDSGGPACSGPNAGAFCFQWALANCGGGGGHCRCSQWAIVNGQFQCLSGCCDCN